MTCSALYENGGDTDQQAPVRPYRDYLTWLAGQDREAALRAWGDAPADVDEATLVAPAPTGPRASPTNCGPNSTKETPPRCSAGRGTTASPSAPSCRARGPSSSPPSPAGTTS